MADQHKLKSFFVVTKLLSKVHHAKKTSDKGDVLEILQSMKYFEKLIHDPFERRDFLQAALPYLKFRFCPKGTIIYEYGSNISSLSVIMEGKAILYVPKNSEELGLNNHDLRNQQVLEHYVEYINQHKLSEKPVSSMDLGGDSPTSRKKKARSMTKIKELAAQTNPSQPPAPTGVSDILEHILKPNNQVLPELLQDFDLTMEEKHLILAYYEQLDKVADDGEFILKSIGTVGVNDTFGGTVLLRIRPSKYLSIASEDVYLVSITKEDLMTLYSNKDFAHTREKIYFLDKMFPDLSREALVKLSFCLEEKVLCPREVIYKEGTKPEAIYIVKNGEIEFTSYDKLRCQDTPRRRLDKQQSLSVQSSPRAKISNLQAGSVFGEEEVINGILRKSSAVAHQVNSLIYVLKKEIYCEMFEKYYPSIANCFKNWLDVKKRWRKDRSGEPEGTGLASLSHKEPATKVRTVSQEPDINVQDQVSEKVQSKQNFFKIQSSVGLKTKLKGLPILDLNSVASPRYQERRLKSLDIQSGRASRFNQSREAKNEDRTGEESKRESSQSKAITKKDIQDQKSHLFLLNQKSINLSAKVKAAQTPRSTPTKLVPISRNNSVEMPQEDSTPKKVNKGSLMIDLRRDLLKNMTGPLSARNLIQDMSRTENNSRASSRSSKKPFMLGSFVNNEDSLSKKGSFEIATKPEGDNRAEKSSFRQKMVYHKRIKSLLSRPDNSVCSDNDSTQLVISNKGFAIKHSKFV